MRNFKKFLALVLAMLMVVSAGAAVSAFDDVADDSTYAAAIADLAEKEIVRGKAADAFDPDANVTRWQMALFIVRAITGETDDANWADGFCYFNDIAAGQYPGAISKAAAAGIILGRTENEFDPTANVNYAEALTMAVRALGYEERDKDGKITFSYPNDYLAKAIDLGLTKGVKVADKYQALTRAETAQIIFNMIYAERNNKDLTFAEEFFGEIGVSNANTYVLVATPKQAIEGFDTVDADLGVVVLAKLDKLGNYDGEMYVKAEDLGITLDEAEKHIGATVVLVNFNEKTGTFARSIIRDAETLTNANVTVKASGKITIKGRTYYVVDEYTDTKIRNEIMLYNGDDLAQITDANKLTGNYQLTLADDDQDGVYDRAIVDTIYVSVFNKFDGKKDLTATNGVWDKAENTYTKELEKGDVFTYTYNKRTATVNVLEVLEAQTAKLTAINTTGYNKDGKYAVKLTIDGETYILGNKDRQALGLTGANVASTDNAINFANISGKKSNTDNGNLDGGPVINYTTEKQFYDLVLGGNVRFYAIDDQIIYVEGTYTADPAKNIAVIKGITAFDSNAVYADLYVKGELVKDAKIISFPGVDFSTLNQFTLSLALNDIYKTYTAGTVVTYYTDADDDYTITAIRTAANDYSEAKDDNGKPDSDIFELTSNGRLFSKGIADQNANGGKVDNARALRTNSDTVFYFITLDKHGNGASVAEPFVGTPADGDYIGSGATIYADKIGYATVNNDKAGIAKIVIVTYTNKEQVSGFGDVVTTKAASTSVVYVSTKGTISKVLGSDIGLTGAEADKNYYSFTADKLGVNMSTGDVVKTVYVKADSDNKYMSYDAFKAAVDADAKAFLKVDANGVVRGVAQLTTGALDNVEKYATGALTNYVEARTISAKVGSTTEISDVTKVVTVSLKDFSSKTDYDWIKNEGKTVWAVKNDKTLVVLVDDTTPAGVDGKVTITVNAKAVVHGAEKAAKADVTVKDGKATATVTAIDAKFEGFNKEAKGEVIPLDNVSYEIVSAVRGSDNVKDKVAIEKISSENDKLTVTFANKVATQFDSEKLAAGIYAIVLKNAAGTELHISFEVK